MCALSEFSSAALRRLTAARGQDTIDWAFVLFWINKGMAFEFELFDTPFAFYDYARGAYIFSPV